MALNSPPAAFAGAGGNGVLENRTPSAFLLGFTESFAKSKWTAPKPIKQKTPTTPSATHSTLVELIAVFTTKKEGKAIAKVEGIEVGQVDIPTAEGQGAATLAFIVPAGASWEYEATNSAAAELEVSQLIATSP